MRNFFFLSDWGESLYGSTHDSESELSLLMVAAKLACEQSYGEPSDICKQVPSLRLPYCTG